jgi:hypothetical protein
MKSAALTAMLAMAVLASAARADGVPQMIGSDPLSREILSKTPLQNGGVTSVMRAGSGEVVVLHLADVSSSFSASLAPAVAAPAVALRPADGLAPRKAKRAKGARMPRGAAKQLRRVHATKSW